VDSYFEQDKYILSKSNNQQVILICIKQNKYFLNYLQAGSPSTMIQVPPFLHISG